MAPGTHRFGRSWPSSPVLNSVFPEKWKFSPSMIMSNCPFFPLEHEKEAMSKKLNASTEHNFEIPFNSFNLTLPFIFLHIKYKGKRLRGSFRAARNSLA